MSLTPERFSEFFGSLYRNRQGQPIEPFPWQTRLARDLAENRWPDCIDLPTASGKTSLIDIVVYTLAAQPAKPATERKIGRRIFFTVNRRVIVDEAFDRAVDLAKALKAAQGGILKEVADALRAIGGDSDLPLDVAQLRGGIYRDSSWARSIVQPMVVCTTADQLGSRLLFRGYGVSPGMQPIHAALCACDSLILLDEAHVTKAFAQTLRLLQRYQQHKPGLRFVEMTATPSVTVTQPFRLDDEDSSHPILNRRQVAPKPAKLEKVANKSLVAKFVELATRAVKEEPKAVGVIVNRVQTARDIEAGVRDALAKAKIDADVHLLIGRMRSLDRDQLQKQLRTVVGPDRPDTLDRPVFIVATQCLEVGADYDFDTLITECASIDALRQRFGRLNRRGRAIAASAAIITTDAAIKDEDPIYGNALRQTWDWLCSKKGESESVDFGIAAFKRLWDEVEFDQRNRLTNLTPDAAVLLPVHLDALCQTNPQPVPSPDVSYFIHGPQRDNLDVSVCWRADLGPDASLWADVVSLLPPTSPECMTVPIRAVRQWMLDAEQPVDADVPVQAEEPKRNKPGAGHTVLRWRGMKDATPISNPNDLRPGDTIIIPASDESSRVLGHLPEYEGQVRYDRAEESFEQAKRQKVVRLHPGVHPELVEPFRSYLGDTETLSKSKIRKTLGALAYDFTAGPDEIAYPYDDPKAVVFRFNKLVPAPDDWKHYEPVEVDGDDSSIGSTRPLLLSKHTADVVNCVDTSVTQLGLDAIVSLYQSAAEYHDVGKADLRFTAMLAGVSPYEVLGRPPLAKSGNRWLSRIESIEQRRRALLPEQFRHETLSMQWVEQHCGELVADTSIDRDLLLHLIAAHHGHARPFMPVCVDQPDDDQLLGFSFGGIDINPATRKQWMPAHRLDSGVADRFWDLTRKHGWWGLAYLESILRLGDQQASAMEHVEGDRQTKEINYE
jgi:CRISPR-associated endonuclease/helicase Cas3